MTDPPEPPFAAGKPREADAYHTAECMMVDRAQPQRLRHLTDNEIEYHELTRCQFCATIKTEQAVVADD